VPNWRTHFGRPDVGLSDDPLPWLEEKCNRGRNVIDAVQFDGRVSGFDDGEGMSAQYELDRQ